MKEATITSRRNFLGKVVTGALGLPLVNSLTNEASAVGNTGSIRSDSAEKKFVPVMLTPYDNRLGIDFDGLSSLIDFYIAAGAKGFFANCLSSEMYDLDNEERLALVRHVVRRVNGRFPVVATGSFGDSIGERSAFTKKMHDTGVDAVILITSHFAEKADGDDILIRNMEKFFSLTSDIPLGTYECPSPYKRILTPEVFRFLLSTKRLIYHKDTSLDPERIRVKLDMAQGSQLEFYDAHSPNTAFSLQHGARGMSCIAGNFYPEIFSWMCANATNPNQQENVNWLQSEITRVDSIISKGYSLSAKYFLKKRGVPIEINSRRTKNHLTDEQRRTLDEVYNTLHAWHLRLGITMKG